MNLLIAIKSCQRDSDSGFHKAIRETWGHSLPSNVNVRFFMGSEGADIIGDETHLSCPDDYRSLPLKTKAIAKWCFAHDVEKTFLCDNDTYVIVADLLKYPWEDVDYAGRFSFWPRGAKLGTTFRYFDGQNTTHDPCHAWASGGYGYFLSKKTMALVADMTPCSWAEDLSVGQLLGPLVQSNQIVAKNFEYSEQCVWHIEKNINLPFTPQRIYDYHKRLQP